MPHLVEMHKKYAKDGLVVITVSVDELSNKDQALKFLRQKQATFQNFLLNEEADLWQMKFMTTSPPAAVLYDREGKRVVRFDTDDADNRHTSANVEKAVKKLLQAKP